MVGQKLNEGTLPLWTGRSLIQILVMTLIKSLTWILIACQFRSPWLSFSGHCFVKYAGLFFEMSKYVSCLMCSEICGEHVQGHVSLATREHNCLAGKPCDAVLWCKVLFIRDCKLTQMLVSLPKNHKAKTEEKHKNMCKCSSSSPVVVKQASALHELECLGLAHPEVHSCYSRFLRQDTGFLCDDFMYHWEKFIIDVCCKQ